MYTRQNAVPPRHIKQIPLSARIGRSGLVSTSAKLTPITRQHAGTEMSRAGSLATSPMGTTTTTGATEKNYWGHSRTARPPRKQVNIWETWQQQRQGGAGGTSSSSSSSQQQLSTNAKPGPTLSLSEAKRYASSGLLGGKSVLLNSSSSPSSPSTGVGLDLREGESEREEEGGSAREPTSPLSQQQQQAFNASYDSFVPEIHRVGPGKSSPSDSNPPWMRRAERMLHRRRETQQYTGPIVAPTPQHPPGENLEGTTASGRSTSISVEEPLSQNNSSFLNGSYHHHHHHHHTNHNPNNHSHNNTMSNSSLNNSRFEGTHNEREDENQGGPNEPSRGSTSSRQRRRHHRSSVMDTITIVDELPESFRDGGVGEESDNPAASGKGAGGSGGRPSGHRHSYRSGSGLLGGSGSGQRWMLQAAGLRGNEGGSFDGLDLDILSDLNATLSGTRHSTFERTRSLDGTLNGTTGVGGAIRSPSVLEGTLNTTLSSTLRGTLTNFNDTLGRKERAEMIAEEFQRLEAENAVHQGDEDTDVRTSVDGNPAYPAASEVQQGMEGLKAAVRIAEALTAEYETTAHMSHPMARERLELPPPRTQAAIARLFPHKPPAPLDVSVGVEALSLQSLRRRFGPPTTLAHDAYDEEDDEEDDEHSGQLSVCSAARSLFHERAPSDCQSRMAVSRLERASVASSTGGLSHLGGSKNKLSPTKRQQARRPLYMPTSPLAKRDESPDVTGKGSKRKRGAAKSRQQRSALLAHQSRLRQTNGRSGPHTDTDVKGPRVLKQSAAALLSKAMREREQRLLLHMQDQPEKSKLLTLVRQWCDRTRLERDEETGEVFEDPAAAHLVAMDRVLKEEEYARSRQHYARLHAREKLRMESIEARDSSEARFTLPLTVDVLGPHKTLCRQLNPFGVEEGAQENYEFISAVKQVEEDDYDVYSSGSFSSTISSHITSSSQAFSIGEPSLSTHPHGSPPSGSGGPSVHHSAGAPFGAVPVTEGALTAAENGLLELLLLALVDNSNWGNPSRPFAPKLPSIVYPAGDVEGTAKRLSAVQLKNAVRCTDLINLLDLQVGLLTCVGSHGVAPPPVRSVAAPNGCRLLPLVFTQSDELGLRGMSRCDVETLPLVLCITMNRPLDAGGPFQCSVGMDLLELFRQLPVVVAENFVRFRGGGSSQNPHYRVNIPQWCKAVWRRVMIEVQRAAVEAYYNATRTHNHVFDPFAPDAAGGANQDTITECELDAFEIDWHYCLQLSRWRVESLKRLADAHWKDDMQPITVTTPMRGTMEAAAASSLTQAPGMPPCQKGGHKGSTVAETAGAPAPAPATGPPRRTSTSVPDLMNSSSPLFSGPPMAGDIPYAPGPRVYYVFDMQNLYLTASLALDQCNFMLFPRAEQLAHQFRQLEDQLRAEAQKGTKSNEVSPRSSMEPGCSWRSREATPMLSRVPSQSLELRIEAMPGGEKPRLGLATALKQWSGVHKVLDTETSYSLCLNTIHAHEVSIVNFNGHVTQYNAYRSKESLIWGPIYKSGLRLAYALCIYLEVRPFDAMPEKLVSFLHPIAQFSGCSGGYREMKANLKEVKISIAERCRRAAVAVEIMTIDTAEQLLEAAMEALNFCRNASDIVSCQATEDDVLTTSLRPVALPEKNFTDVPILTAFSDL